jgi:hypothetical protein
LTTESVVLLRTDIFIENVPRGSNSGRSVQKAVTVIIYDLAPSSLHQSDNDTRHFWRLRVYGTDAVNFVEINRWFIQKPDGFDKGSSALLHNSPDRR